MSLPERRKPGSGTLRSIALVLAACVTLFGFYRLIIFGSVLRSCSYSETPIQLPEALAAATLMLTRDIQPVEAEPSYACLDKIGHHPQLVSKVEYFQQTQGRALMQGDQLKVKEILRVEGHGLVNIEGKSDLEYLILEDRQGHLYEAATVSLGVDDTWIEYQTPTSQGALGFFNFTDPESFQYRFKLPELLPIEIFDPENPKDYRLPKTYCDHPCCERSLAIIKSHRFPFYIGRCPRNFQRRSLECIQSLSWCEPQK